MKKYALAVHGGAGTINRKFMTAELDKEHREAIMEALVAGDTILKNGGNALDAVEAALIKIENAPQFNAGKGSVFTNQGTIEMDAAIMCGKTLLAGAIAGVSNIKNPVSLARSVMNSGHVFLYGKGAEEFARFMNIQFQDDAYFFTQFRYDQLLAIRETNKSVLDHCINQGDKFGTGGAVALDQHGNLAAATSTGGMTNKKFNRIGDTPVIGAGTYANNKTCAISCTGHGEYFIRAVAAHDVSCLMEYKGLSLKEASHVVINEKLQRMDGEGGLIAIDSQGNIALPFNTEGMYRGVKTSGGTYCIAIYKDDELLLND